MNRIERQTINSYSLLWDKANKQKARQEKTHFEAVQDILDVPIVKDGIGLEVGYGVGHDIEYMAEKYPESRFIAIDFSYSINLSAKLLYSVCVIFSPVVYILFSLPAKFLNRFKRTRSIANKVPFNFGRHPFNLVGDLFDRFGTPIEKRYGKDELIAALRDANFKHFILTKMPDTAGWVVLSEK